MARIIHDVRELLEELRPGVKFWHLTTVCGEPTGVSGPHTVTRITHNKVFYPFRRTHRLRHESEYGEASSFLADLTNQWHGVCLSEEDAAEAFRERRSKFNSDPEWQARVRREHLTGLTRDDSWRDMY